MTFFIVVTPGLERLAERELKSVWTELESLYPNTCKKPLPDVKVHKGGLEVELDEAAGWILNHYLKVPTRILQRIGSFTAKDFIKLYKKLQKFDWQKYLRQGNVEVVVSTYQSRLKIKERLAKTVQDAIASANEHQPLRKKFLETPQTVFLRMENDLCTISLDTSGEPLYKRGYKTMSVEAPLRETLAAACSRWFLNAIKPVPSKTIFVDPVCGSGTLLLELASLGLPPRHRQYAYRNFPSAGELLPEKKWEALRGPEPGWSYEGYDMMESAVIAAKKNAERLGLEAHFAVRDLLEDIKIEDGIRAVLMNPPYGERLQGLEAEALVLRAIENYDPIALLLVLPSELKRPQLSSDYKWHTTELRTLNGGIEVTIRLATRK